MPRISSVYEKNSARVSFDFTEIMGTLASRAIFIDTPLKESNFEVSGVYDCVNAAETVYKLLKGQVKL